MSARFLSRITLVSQALLTLAFLFLFCFRILPLLLHNLSLWWRFL